MSMFKAAISYPRCAVRSAGLSFSAMLTRWLASKWIRSKRKHASGHTGTRRLRRDSKRSPPAARACAVHDTSAGRSTQHGRRVMFVADPESRDVPRQQPSG